MKKLVGIFIFVLIFIFFLMLVMVLIDKNNIKDIENDIVKNINIKNIVYLNKYDNSYVVIDRNNLYLFNSNYDEIFKVELDLLYENKNNYDIVYRNNIVMYMNNYKKNGGVIFKYYDIYTYELIDEVIIGGKKNG